MRNAGPPRRPRLESVVPPRVNEGLLRFIDSTPARYGQEAYGNLTRRGKKSTRLGLCTKEHSLTCFKSTDAVDTCQLSNVHGSSAL